MKINHNLQAVQISQTLGVPVFPCSKSKKPLTSAGYKDATDVPSHIALWWEETPNALIGMPTGARSGYTVVDLDGGEKGEASFAKLGKVNQETIQVRTQSGGRHLWYKHPEGKHIPCDIGRKLGPFIDVKGDGGYVLIPPSATDIGRYEFIEGFAPWQIEVAPLPQILIDKLTEPAIRRRKKPATRATKGLNLELLLSPILEGSRDVELTSRCGHLMSFYGPRIEVLELLKDLNKRCCLPPLTEREVEKIFNSIRKRELRNGPN
jgi:hypothetical protein